LVLSSCSSAVHRYLHSFPTRRSSDLRWNFDGEVDGYVLNFSTQFFQSFLLRPDYIDEFTFFQGQAKQSVLDIPTDLRPRITTLLDRKSTRLNSSHVSISYAVFCLKKK